MPIAKSVFGYWLENLQSLRVEFQGLWSNLFPLSMHVYLKYALKISYWYFSIYCISQRVTHCLHVPPSSLSVRFAYSHLPLGSFSHCLHNVSRDSRASNQIALRITLAATNLTTIPPPFHEEKKSS